MCVKPCSDWLSVGQGVNMVFYLYREQLRQSPKSSTTNAHGTNVEQTVRLRHQNDVNTEPTRIYTEQTQIYMEPTWINTEATRIYTETTLTYMDQHWSG